MTSADPAVPSPRAGPGPGRALAVLAAVLAAFFFPALLTSGQFLFRDAGRMHWPMKRYIAEELSRGHLPQWNPYLGLGFPLVGDAVNAVQHPFNLLLVLLPFPVGYKLWVLLSYLVAATGAFAWARRLGLGWHAALAAGMAYGLSGHLVSASDNLHYLTTLAAVPWIFAAGHAFAERGGPGRLALVGCASAFTAAAGDPMGWGLAVAALPVLAVLFAGRPGERRRALGRGVAAAGTAAAFAAPFLLPMLAWLPHSSRAIAIREVELARYNLQPLRLLELAVPHVFRPPAGSMASEVYWVYGGEREAGVTLPWALSIYAGASVVALAALGAARRLPPRLLVLAAALFAWMAMGPNAGFGQLARHLPVLGKLRYWEKMAAWPALFLAIAAAWGIEEIRQRRPVGRFVAALVALAVPALAAWAAVAAFPEPVAGLLQRGAERRAARLLAANLEDGLLQAGIVWLALAGAVLALRGRPSLPAALVLLPLVAADLFAGNGRAWLLAPPAVAEPGSALVDYLRARPEAERVIAPFESSGDRWPELPPAQGSLLADAQTLVAASNVRWRIASFQPYVALVPERLWALEHELPWDGQAPIAGLWNVAYLVVPKDPSLAARTKLTPPFEVAASDPWLPAFLVRLPHRPRAYLAGEVVAVDRRGAMAFALDRASIASPRSVVEGEVPAGQAPPRGEVRFLADEPERVVVETTSDRGALLVLNDMYAVGWSAAVDGRPAAILPANFLARGVWVEAGRHAVAFTYRTPMLREGWAILGASALALAAAGAQGLRARRRR